MNNKKKAILVVSFGTSYTEARIASIEKIEQEIATAFPEYEIYHAWTSKMILSVLCKRGGDTLYHYAGRDGALDRNHGNCKRSGADPVDLRTDPAPDSFSVSGTPGGARGPDAHHDQFYLQFSGPGLGGDPGGTEGHGKPGGAGRGEEEAYW